MIDFTWYIYFDGSYAIAISNFCLDKLTIFDLSWLCYHLIYQSISYYQCFYHNNPLPESGCVGGDDKKVCICIG